MKDLIEKFEQHKGCEIVINAFNEIIATDEMEVETILYSDAKRVLEGVFDNLKVHVNDSSGDPRLETSMTVSGEEYIEMMFNGDYDEALDYILQFVDV